MLGLFSASKLLAKEIACELSRALRDQTYRAFLWMRLRREMALLRQDVRGWPLRLVHARALRRELRLVLPHGHHEKLVESLPTPAATPTVSVVIPIYGKVELTLRCLASLAHSSERTTFEVIVVDDASPDDSQSRLEHVTGIRYVRNDKNSGFIASCNRGASLARGEYLHFLNNDTVVLPGWLDELVRTFESESNVGMVGSRLIYPDLRLQESGGVVWRDASATNWGNGHDPWNPRFTYLRDVDYCSAASVLMRKGLFDHVGGFDSRYAPAYYEDTDLAFKVRAHGARVVVQPASRVLHFEGATSGTNVQVGPKKHQLTNQTVFEEKWRSTLATHGLHGDIGAAELDRAHAKAILVIGAGTPKPDQDSGSVDLVNMFEILRGLGLRITYLPAYPMPRLFPFNITSYEGRYSDALARDGVENPYFPYERSVGRFLRERGKEFAVVMLMRARVSDRFLSAVRKHAPQAKVVFHTVDLHYLREEREAELRKSWWLSWMARDTKWRELRCVRESDATLVLSAAEAEVLRREVPSCNLHVIPLLRKMGAPSPHAGDRASVLFVGGFRHRPNVDAVQFLVDEIWPLVRMKNPAAKLHIAGSATPTEVFALACSDIIVHGHVPELDTLLQQVALSVAPLRYGAGLKGKVAASLGVGVPVVTTSVGAEGSGLVHRHHAMIADDAESFAQAIDEVLRDRALWETLSQNGAAFAREQYSLESNRAPFSQLLESVGIKRP